MQSKLLLLLLFLLPIVTNAKAGDPISVRGLAQLQEYIDNEKEVVHSATHRSRFDLKRNDQGEYIRTSKVFAVLHGLYNSPAYSADIHKQLLTYNQNTVSIRLAKHFEKQKRSLDQVQYTEWLEQMQQLRNLLSEFGEQLIFLGHSTGGLLSFHTTLEDASNVQALVLFAPALKIAEAALSRARLGARLGVGFFDHEGRYLSPLAALQVHELSIQTMKNFPTDEIQKPHLLIVDTASDNSVDIAENRRTVEALAANGVAAKYVELPRSSGVSHPEIMEAGSPALDLAKDFLNAVFTSEKNLLSVR